KAAHSRAGLAEDRVVRRDGQVTDQVQDVPAADRVAGDRSDDRLGQRANLPLQIEDVEPGNAVLADVPAVPPHLLIATGAESLRAGAGQNDDAARAVVARAGERVGHLCDGLRAKGVAHFGAVNGDLRDAVPRLVKNIFVGAGRFPRKAHGLYLAFGSWDKNAE